ncbi:MAG TPA: methyltransferase [Methylomirabilota bacterium]|nr:methyltransferase [Methylomirabilota bacterium]
MRVVVMRHADAGEADPRRWPDDRDRPLTDAGRREHARVAEALRRLGLRFDRILTSPLARARETADITARIFGDRPTPEPTDLLGDRADPATIVAALSRVKAETLLCVGHEPTLSGLVAALISGDGTARVAMAKSGVAVIECGDAPAPGRGVLRLHLRPAEIVRLLDETADPPLAAPAPPTPDAFMGTLTAYQRSAALKGALDLDLFTAIGGSRETAAAVATRCGASPRGTRILCDYLTVAGFLTKSGDRYALTADSARFLDRRSPACVAAAADFVYAPELREAFADVAAAVRRGGTVMGPGTVAPDHPVWVCFARAMAPLMSAAAEAVVDLVEVDPGQPLRVLDVAAGHGMFGIAFGRRHPRSVITALDWSAVLEVAQENARAAGLARRFRTIAGSAFEADLDGPYDLVLVPNFLHHFDPATCERFMVRVKEALAPAGRAITVEFVPDEGRVTPPHAAMFSLVMLCSTPAGDAYTFAELDAMFRRAGLGESELRVPGPGGPQVIISQR